MIKHLANMVTLTNLLFGILSLKYTMSHEYALAGIMIMLAVLMDSTDGRVARHFGIVCEMGKELDSLADVVSFGVAPAMLVYSALLCNYPFWGIFSAIFFVLAGAYRLARFNTTNQSEQFIGVPITAAGGLLSVLILLSRYLPSWWGLAVLPLLGVLMVSRVKVPKIK